MGTPDIARKRASRANQVAWRQQRAEDKRRRNEQSAAARRILSEDEEDVGTPAQGRGTVGCSGAESEDDSDSGSGMHAPPW